MNVFQTPHSLWRGSLLPLGCEAAPKAPFPINLARRGDSLGAAAQPSGSELPRHKSSFHTDAPKKLTTFNSRKCPL
ncbi:hypothetical protein CF597_12945 [Pseudomonas sp. PSB1]|nr:hypothetical protein [Pseudomonas sp. PSB1]